MEVEVKLPEKLLPVFLADNMRVRGAYGGRGSGKTRSFAKMAAVKGVLLSSAGERGVILCVREYMNSLEESSFAEIREAILSEDWLMSYYDIGEKYIRTKDKRINFVFSGMRHNIDSIKSKSKIHLMWADEAEAIGETAWSKAIISVREQNSEIWVTWNPERNNSATHKRFRESKADDVIVVEMNYQDNPWFPEVLERERLRDLDERPEDYHHVWEGGFKTHVKGAYYARNILQARSQQRVGVVPADPHLPVKLFCDIGGTGAKSDAFTMWAGQFVGNQIRLLNYYEAQGQELGHHLGWMRNTGYGPEQAEIYLPHDGKTQDKVFAVSYESAFKGAGYKVTVIPNQGKGAAAARIEAARKLFPAMWFNEETTKDGLYALGFYHEKYDEDREIGLGPCHDWSSHCADAFGLMAVAYKPPKSTHNTITYKIHRPRDRAIGY